MTAQEQEAAICQAEKLLGEVRQGLFAVVEARGQVMADLPGDPLYEARCALNRATGWLWHAHLSPPSSAVRQSPSNK